jgi:hypothetical protein
MAFMAPERRGGNRSYVGRIAGVVEKALCHLDRTKGKFARVRCASLCVVCASLTRGVLDSNNALASMASHASHPFLSGQKREKSKPNLTTALKVNWAYSKRRTSTHRRHRSSMVVQELCWGLISTDCERSSSAVRTSAHESKETETAYGPN